MQGMNEKIKFDIYNSILMYFIHAFLCLNPCL